MLNGAVYEFSGKYRSMNTDSVFIFARKFYEKYRLRTSEFRNFRTQFAECFDTTQPNKPTSALETTGEKLSVPKLRINCTVFIPPPVGIFKLKKWWGLCLQMILRAMLTVA